MVFIEKEASFFLFRTLRFTPIVSYLVRRLEIEKDFKKSKMRDLVRYSRRANVADTRIHFSLKTTIK